MGLTQLLQWGGGGLLAFLLGYIYYLQANKHFLRGYKNTKTWIRTNKKGVQELTDEARTKHSTISERMKWLQEQVVDALFGDFTTLMSDKIKAIQTTLDDLRNRLEGLDDLYDTKSEEIVSKVEAFWANETKRFQKEAEDCHPKIAELTEQADALRVKLAEEQERLADVATKQNTEEVSINRLSERLEEQRKRLPLALDSVLSLWLVFLLIIIDLIFAWRSIEAVFVGNNVIVKFFATTVFVVPLIALFEYLYAFTEKAQGLIGRMLQLVAFGLCLGVAIKWGVPAILGLRADGDVFSGVANFDLFALSVLPLIAFLVAHLIHQWQKSSKQKDALVFLIGYLFLWLHTGFARLGRSLSGTAPKSNPRVANLNREIGDKMAEIEATEKRRNVINTQTIPELQKKKDEEVEAKKKQVLEAKGQEIKNLNESIKAEEKKLSAYEAELSAVRKGSLTACQRFMVIA